jgi:hypothetical protein
MFKVGDKVRFNQDYGYVARKGETGVVTKIKKTNHTKNKQTTIYIVTVSLTEGQTTECFDFRLDKVSDEPFNVSTATDQELADEYRRLRQEMKDEYRRLREEQRPVFDELRRRGYSINFGFEGKVKIIKQQTVTL